MAAILGIARNTVTSAYEQLAEEGSLLAQERSGVLVSRLAAPPHVDPGAWPKAAARNWQPDFAIRLSGLLHISKPRDWQSYPYPFLFWQFDPTLFPVQAWRESAAVASSVTSVNDWAGDLIDEDDPELVSQLRAPVLSRR